MITQSLQRQQTLKIPDQQLEYLSMLEMPQHIHLLLSIITELVGLI